FCK
ncbi:hypothetical protein ABKN59_002526, partial [Abortiporus biennis]